MRIGEISWDLRPVSGDAGQGGPANWFAPPNADPTNTVTVTGGNGGHAPFGTGGSGGGATISNGGAGPAVFGISTSGSTVTVLGTVSVVTGEPGSQVEAVVRLVYIAMEARTTRLAERHLVRST